ncbi:uncharacterized protein SCODWIG_00139 [Saccharomycodes ludwigii]|uniref:Protein ECM19 n=1 Tax=Saccharomycodes ludwigii TaxID=36035 RepID=A0A376B118_9ASCO|nr:uncharacterized protein SCODWIG_00139 [Saccharomycodes ludwigii]
MGRLKSFDLTVLGVIFIAGIYTGTKFFEPIVIDQLKKDGNLRTDIEVPLYDDSGNPLVPKNMMNIKDELTRVSEERNKERAFKEEQFQQQNKK